MFNELKNSLINIFRQSSPQPEKKDFFVMELNDNKNEEIKEKAKTLTSIHKSSVISNLNSFYFADGYKTKRKKLMTENMDELIELIKEESSKQEFLARTISNIAGKISKKQYTFSGPNKKKVALVQKKFKEILKNSNYNENSYFKEMLMNFDKYSNNFTIPIINKKTDKLERVLIIQNYGWHVHQTIGTCYAKSFVFAPEDGESKKIYKNEEDVWHYTFNKETDEIFAMPMWIPVIPALKKYNYLLSSTIDSYSDQAISRTIYEVGVDKKGARVATKVDTHEAIRDLLENTEDDIIVDTPVGINVVTKTFTSPDKILETLKQKIVAGLFTSESQLGISNAGRQDSETQNENTLITAEDFLNDLELQINQTFIKRICKDLFGDCTGDNEVELLFEDNFNIKERKEKHAVYLFQSGIIDLDEARKSCSKLKDINPKKTFFELYQQKEMSGEVESTNNPRNQHTPQGTGTTKKTKKDNRRQNE